MPHSSLTRLINKLNYGRIHQP